MDYTKKIDDIFLKLGNLFSLLFAVVVAIGFFEVVMRYVFDSPTIWVHETTTFLVSIAMLYGGVACFAENKHIRMEFIREKFSKKTQWYLELLVQIFMFIFILMMTYGSYLTTMDAFISPFGSFKMQTSGSALDTPFPAFNKGFFFISCLLLLLLSLTHTVRHFLTKRQFL